MSETYIDLARRMMQEAVEEQKAGHYDDAIRLYQASINFYPTAEAHTFLGWVYSKQRRFEEAIEECKNAITVDPDFGNPYNDIGSYLIDLGRPAEAIEWLEKAIDAPRYETRALPYMNLGRAYKQLGQDFEALRAFKRATQIDPSHAGARDAYHVLLCKLN
jgi:Tfp pilus assembly protein PilF